MSKFALNYPFFIIMLCLVALLVGVVSIVSMPVDLFPQIDIPVVVVATFYAGMPPQQIEADITDTFERFFTLGSNIDHIESRSLTGVSLIKVYFRPGTDPNAALSNIANLAMADLQTIAAGHSAPGCAQHGRLEPAGVPGDRRRARASMKPGSKIWRSLKCAIRSPTSKAPPFRSPLAEPTGRSRCTSIPSSWRRTIFR